MPNIVQLIFHGLADQLAEELEGFQLDGGLLHVLRAMDLLTVLRSFEPMLQDPERKTTDTSPSFLLEGASRQLN